MRNAFIQNSETLAHPAAAAFRKSFQNKLSFCKRANIVRTVFIRRSVRLEQSRGNDKEKKSKSFFLPIFEFVYRIAMMHILVELWIRRD